jgi:tRNA(fMet)-specific endonuclease VapC
MYLLDTDTLSLFLLGHEPVVRRVQEVGESAYGTTIFTKAEILRGRIEYLRKADTPADVLRAQELFDLSERQLASLKFAPFTEAAATTLEGFGRVKGLRRIGRVDLLIASVVLAQRDTLVTRNLRHFQKIPGLTVANWAD